MFFGNLKLRVFVVMMLFGVSETKKYSYVERDEMIELKVPMRQLATCKSSLDRVNKVAIGLLVMQTA